jgi:hypothetical protein
MYSNLGGLSGLYVRNGVISSMSQLFVFARGFNSSQDMFNLVDVGTGKEGADHKIRGELQRGWAKQFDTTSVNFAQH